MPNRILKESICSSDNIDQLTAFQETFFYRLIVNCDDYGRMDARPKILASRLFPLKEIRSNQIEDALRALTSAELVILYEVDGKPFLQMKTWDRHQQVRAKRSKYPSPDEGTYKQMIADASKCEQTEADASKCPRNPIQSEYESNPNTNTKKEPQKRFTPPTVDEVREYCKERGNNVDPQHFVDYYQSQRWKKSNGQPLVDWKAGVRTWEGNDFGKKTATKLTKPVNAQQYSQRNYDDKDEDVIQRMLRMGGGEAV